MVASFGPTWVGSRDMRDVEDRLLEKLQSSDDPAKLEAAAEMLVELVSTTGAAATVIAAADNVVGSRGLERGLLDPARELASFLSGTAGIQEIDQIWDSLDSSRRETRVSQFGYREQSSLDYSESPQLNL